VMASTNEKALRRAFAKRLPSLNDLVTSDQVEALARAWKAGNSRAFSHPLIELLFGDAFAERTAGLDEGIAKLREQNISLAQHVRRLTLSKTDTASFTEALGAINELWVAAPLAAAGASIAFVGAGSTKTPDISATIHGETLTLEVTTWGQPSKQVAEHNKLNYAFTTWRPGKRLPKDLKGHARDYGDGLRMMEKAVSLLDGDTIAKKVQILTGKKSSSQLKQRQNPILVISARHQWGVSASDCVPRRGFRSGHHSGVCYAAAYGRSGDYLFDGEEFEGKGQRVDVQLGDGILRRSSSLAGLLYLFNVGQDVFFENLQASSGLSPGNMRFYLRRAFSFDPAATIFRER
jgi:hypothetical protein